MLWKTHIRITFEALRRLGIPLTNLEESRLKEGVLAPDKWKDYPHHYKKEREIQDNLLLSRKYFLKDDFPNAYYYLGVALHYIQDAYTSMASFYPGHHSWEESIENCNCVSNLEETIHYWLRDNSFERSRCLGLANALSMEPYGKDDTLRTATLSGHEALQTFAKPIIDFNLGFRASYLVTKSVLSPRSNSQLDLALKQSLASHETSLHNAELAISTKMIDMAKQVENLENKRITKSGIVPKLKNWLLSLRVEIKNFQLNSTYNGYVQKRHLLEVSGKYKEATDGIISPNVGWFAYSRPELNFSVIKNQLIPLQEVSKYFMVDEQTIRDSLKKNNASSYVIGDKELVDRKEVNRIMTLSLKNVREYPH
jgi:hypothetical protein